MQMLVLTSGPLLGRRVPESKYIIGETTKNLMEKNISPTQICSSLFGGKSQLRNVINCVIMESKRGVKSAAEKKLLVCLSACLADPAGVSAAAGGQSSRELHWSVRRIHEVSPELGLAVCEQ